MIFWTEYDSANGFSDFVCEEELDEMYGIVTLRKLFRLVFKEAFMENLCAYVKLYGDIRWTEKKQRGTF